MFDELYIKYFGDRLARLIKKHALVMEETKLASGKMSPYYLDGRKIVLTMDGIHCVGKAILEIVLGYPDIVSIGGPSIGADPIIGAVLAMASASNDMRLRNGIRFKNEISGFLVRPKAKEHGRKQLIEGNIVREGKVAIIDDVVTTGGSMINAVKAIRELGCEVSCAIAIVDRLEGARESFNALSIPFHSLLTVKDLGITPP